MRPNFIGRTLVAILLWPMQCWQHCNSLILYPRGSARDPAGGSAPRPSEIATDNIQLSRVNFFQKIYLKFFKFFFKFFLSKKIFFKKNYFHQKHHKRVFLRFGEVLEKLFFLEQLLPLMLPSRWHTHRHTDTHFFFILY